jgi:diguanylate cyclase (GGDEF)-like protein/PAS domain S-box-containing protein
VKKRISISNQQLQAVFEQAAVGMVIVDAAQSRFVKVNHRFCEIVGYSAEELLRGSINDITHPDDLRMDLGHVEQISNGIARETSWEKRYLRKDGAIVWARVFVTPLDPSEARPTLRIGVIEEITNRKRAEETLRESEEKFRLLIENAPDAIYVHTDAKFIYLNHAAVTLFGAETADQLIGSPLLARFHPEYHETIAGRLHALYQERKKLHIVEQVYLRLDGSLVPVEAHAIPIIYNNENAALTFARDITDRKRAEEALRESEKKYRELSIIDDLTQLYNSRYFYHQLKMEIDRAERYGQPLTLLLLDIDDFKRYNDAYGHIEGDEVLLRLGQVVKRCLRQTDTAYRYGGEEFVVLLPMTTSVDGAVTAERIRTEFKRENFSLDPGPDVHVTMSIGVAQFQPQEEMKAYVHRVDKLMYQAKQNGKDRVCSESKPE